MSVANAASSHPLANLTQLLEEHHLVVLSDGPAPRRALALALTRHLASFSGTEVVRIDGTAVHDAAAVAAALGARTARAPVRPAGVDVRAIVAALRRVPAGIRHRYIIWTEADELLERDVGSFSEVVNAMLAVAVEHEHFSPEPLILQRAVFTGGAKLGAYAEEENGQFRRWRLRGGGAEVRAAAEFVARPPVITYRLDG